MRPWFGFDEAEQRLEHRALAGAVRSEQPDGAALEARRDVLERLVLAVDDRHPFELDGWGAGGPAALGSREAALR